ncbi:MAG: hypothetical protein JO170_21640 [Verrucomicrobia bacterium]|nr:hypothetical protein [Verrucomicrobiota bacterium]
MTKKPLWSSVWKDFQTEHAWRFPEVPPWQIHRYLGYPIVDYSENLRAEWHWRRRPREILGRGVGGYVLVVVISILFLLTAPVGFVVEAVWLFTCVMLIALDVVRNVRWRRDYEASLCRLIRTMSRPESI